MRTYRAMAALGVLACTLAASPALSASGSSPAHAAAAAATATTAASPIHIVVVRTKDHEFLAPSSISAGTHTFLLENVGNEVHHLWLVKIERGRSYEDLLKAMDNWSRPKLPDWAIDVGGPNDVTPGMTGSATITLDAGRYAMVCYVPSPDGRPHVTQGMVRELTVTRDGATPPNEPTPDVRIRLTDYAFDMNKPITTGDQIIRVENVATQSHEMVIGELLPGKTMGEALTWLNEGQHGKAPVIAVGGASGLSTGRHQFVNVNLPPGRYVLLCFIPDARDAKPHTVHGMAREITVAAPVAKSEIPVSDPPR